MVNLFRILHAEWLSPLVHEYSCLVYIQEHSWCNFAFMNYSRYNIRIIHEYSRIHTMNILEFIP